MKMVVHGKFGDFRFFFVWIQNRGPEQEIPAVTRVRLIAQKYQYWHLFHKSYWKIHKSYWKLN